MRYRLAIILSLWFDIDWVYNIERFNEQDVGGLESPSKQSSLAIAQLLG